ncbi:MAG: serine/threonine-protein kinase [Deltaproteobacteria bacterium]|nr:serine/threonine-protein kinase [Deltaproteobacteria bacterium]
MAGPESIVDPSLVPATGVQAETSRESTGGREAVDALGAGDQLGRYQIVRLLGYGGMGRVFEGRDPRLGRPVAIKVLYRRWNNQDSPADQHRLRREAKALAALSHPNVVQVYDVGATDGRLWVAMELVDGLTLAAWLDHARSPAQILSVFTGAARGLAAAHEQGLIHRDFKLTNVIVDPSGRARVLDFGLSTALFTEELGPAGTGSFQHDPDMFTEDHGLRVGTPLYMSPEQLHGLPTDARADQFAFCVALHVALHGRYPVAVLDQSPRDMSHPIIEREPVPASLARVIERGMSPSPDDRFADLPALMAAVRGAVRPWYARWPARMTAMAGVTGGLLWSVWPSPSQACTGLQASISEVWSDVQRVELERALVTEEPRSHRTWALSRTRFDRYGERWVQARRDACEQGRADDALLDRRMACLDRRLAAFGGVIAGVRHDGAEAETALRAALELSSPERCLDAQLLAAEPVPDDPSVAARVELIRHSLAHVEGTIDAGAYGAALDQLAPLVSEAELLRYGPLTAEALAMQAQATNGLLDNERTRELLERAYLEASSSGHHDRALVTAIDLISVIGVHGRAPEDARPWVRQAEALLERQGRPPEHAAALDKNLGLLAYARGEYATAIEALERSAAALRTAGNRGPALGNLYNNLGVNRQLQGQLAEAAVAYEQALVIYEESFGDDHPVAGQVLANLGVAQRRLGNAEASRVSLERSIAIISDTMGPDNPALYAPLVNLGNLDVYAGDLATGVPRIERALAILEQARGREDPALAEPLDALGNALAMVGRYHDAAEHYARAARLLSKTPGSSPHTLAHVVMGHGAALRMLGDRQQARARLREAVRLFDGVDGDPGPVGEAKMHLAYAIDDPADARQQMLDALDHFERAEDRADDVAEARQWLEEHGGLPAPAPLAP